ncbi:hypothetical protein Taro_027842 [Colocasia esculenta]|uniref:Ubiquitin-like protease family profile domain-containing protein n=1 Tax=Colocasia esculenta TaxID=4460 RepID=A0A843VEY4_COLES|nr:hypothetical protein [Colocasia esculenta]
MRQIEEIMCYIHKRDEPVTHEEGVAGATPTISKHVHVQPPMMDDDPVNPQEWAAWPLTFSQYVPDVPDVQPPMTNGDQAPPIGHFEEDLTTTVDAQNPNSMVRVIKEREDRRPGVYDQSPYVREKPITMPEKEKVVATQEPVTANWVCKGELKDEQNAIVDSFLETCGSVDSESDFGVFEFAKGLVIWKSHVLNLLYGCMTEDTATTVRRMLMEYGAFPDAAKWELHFDSQCPQQASSSLNCAIYVVKYIEAGGWRGRLQDMDRISEIFTFKNDAYSIFWQNGEPKPVSHFTSTDEIKSSKSLVLLHFVREVLLGSDRVLLLSYQRYLHAADHVLSGRNA